MSYTPLTSDTQLPAILLRWTKKVKQYIKRVDAEEAADLLVNQAAKLMADGLDVSESTILEN